MDTVQFKVSRELVVSLKHLPVHLRKLYKKVWANLPFFAEEVENGIMVYIGEYRKLSVFTDEMLPIAKKARELRCEWIRFDALGTVHPEFPTFEEK